MNASSSFNPFDHNYHQIKKKLFIVIFIMFTFVEFPSNFLTNFNSECEVSSIYRLFKIIVSKSIKLNTNLNYEINQFGRSAFVKTKGSSELIFPNFIAIKKKYK